MHAACHQVCLDGKPLNTKRLSRQLQTRGGVVPRLGLTVSLLGRPLQHRYAIRVRCGFWRWIVTAERSGLLMRIATAESRYVVHADEKLTAFVELGSAVHASTSDLLSIDVKPNTTHHSGVG